MTTKNKKPRCPRCKGAGMVDIICSPVGTTIVCPKCKGSGRQTKSRSPRRLHGVVKHPEEQVYIHIYHKYSTLEGHHELGRLVNLTEFMVGVIDGCLSRGDEKKGPKAPPPPETLTPTKQDLAWREFKETIETEKVEEA